MPVRFKAFEWDDKHMLEYSGLKIYWLGHSSFKIKNSTVIYFDPYQIPKGEVADLVLVSHEHFDHCNPDDISKICGKDTVIVAPKICTTCLLGIDVKEVVYVKPGDVVERKGVKMEAVPAYNVDKFRAPGIVFHPREDKRVGFIVEIGGVRIYHAGDTDLIPEMSEVRADIALLPVSGVYAMTPEEAARAAEKIKPKLAIPMHYGAIVASRKEAERFKALSLVPVEILEKETP